MEKLVFRTLNRRKREADYDLIFITKVQGDTDLLLIDSKVNDQPTGHPARNVQGSHQKYIGEAPTRAAFKGHSPQPSLEFMPAKMGKYDGVWLAVLLVWKGSYNSAFGNVEKLIQDK